jgi:hypothetical protein
MAMKMGPFPHIRFQKKAMVVTRISKREVASLLLQKIKACQMQRVLHSDVITVLYFKPPLE